VILLDTHVWVWLASESPRLDLDIQQHLHAHRAGGLGVSVISCWEVAKLVEGGRLVLDQPVARWIETALALPGIVTLPLTPAIAVDSTQLPVPFHRDPADQLLVATARVLNVPLLTADEKIRAYAHVVTL